MNALHVVEQNVTRFQASVDHKPHSLFAEFCSGKCGSAHEAQLRTTRGALQDF